MWKHVSQVLADQFGAYYSIKHKEKIHTGEMHEAWIIDDGIQPVFLKVNDKTFRSMFRAEADQLLLLAKTNTINVPNVYTVGCSHTHSFLLLEALPLDKTNPVDAMGKFGEQLAKLHLIKGADNYGLDFDTWLGPEYQPNGWKENWATFFSEQRIGWQLQICREKNLVFGDIEVLVKKIAELLAKHKPQPALLHGNLWIENCATVKQEIFTYDQLVIGETGNVIWHSVSSLNLSHANSMKVMTALILLMKDILSVKPFINSIIYLTLVIALINIMSS